ncbi:hypothetical protein TruAng_001372 [Truncatella angustata]|nr:hypothetical protein TruAng_001372 [Truncatella angustata]
MLRHLLLKRTSVLAPSLATRAAFQSHKQAAVKPHSTNRAITTVNEQRRSETETLDPDLESFRQHAFTPELPLVMRNSHLFAPVRHWFVNHDGPSASLSDYLTQHSSVVFPYEFLHSTAPGDKDSVLSFIDWLRAQDEQLALCLAGTLSNTGRDIPEESTVFHQFFAPLDLLSKASEYNKLQATESRVKRLYIAQSQLNELPEPLRNDLPVPSIVEHAGKGDVYDSSIWLGLEPTYTPLHRDPNPNLFVQLLSDKTIRLLTPTLGQQLYARVQNQLGSRGNSRFRGTEMMQGPERAALYDAVWGSELSEDILEAVLQPNDALFIPKGWWHSVRSNFHDGRLNASVNWWFR